MARNKSVSDEEITVIVLAAIEETGEKSASFGAISAKCGLAPATLAQRFGSVDGMLRAALMAEWARLTNAVIAAEAEALVSSKGAQGLLKSLPCPTVRFLSLSMRDTVATEAAASWRTAVEAALAARRGGGTKGREAAALIFAAWQGRQLWEAAGSKGFRLSDLFRSF